MLRHPALLSEPLLDCRTNDRVAAGQASDHVWLAGRAVAETLLRNVANSLFRAASLESRPVRVVRVRDRAINAFVSTGNRRFGNAGLCAPM